MPRQIDLFPQNLQVNHDPTKQLGFTAAQYNNLQAGIPAALEKAEIVFVNSVLAAIDQVTGWNLLAFAQQVEAGITDTGNFATDFWNYLLGTNTTATNAWNNWTTLLEELGLPDQTATALVSWLQTLLEPNSPLNASNLWGLLPTNVAGSIASTAVNAATPNPLWNPNFEAAISVLPGSGWLWDSTVYYSTSTNMPGSAKVVANSSIEALRSNPVPVQGGQTITLTAQILTSGLVSTGSPIELDVVTYLGNTQVAQVSVASSGAPSGATTSWVNPPSGSVAGVLTGTYTVPNDGSVDSVVVRLAVDAPATAGSVWFGSVSASLSGGLIATIQSDLSSLSSDFTAGNTALATFLQSGLGDITGYTSWSTFITNLESQWNTYITTATSLTSAEFFTIQQLINTLLGISPTTGQMAATNVSNALPGGTNLGTDVQAMVDDVTNLFSGNTSSGNALSQLVSDGEAALRDLLPGVFDNNDGTLTAAPNSGVVDNGDGTLTYSPNPPYYMFDNGDGTISTPASALQNIGTGIGTNNYAVQTAATANQNILDTWIQQYGAPVLNNITTVENDIINFLTNAISGGSAPTSANSAAQSIYDALLGIPHTNIVIPPSPGAGMITWDATYSGTPYNGTVNNFVTINYNHTVATTANYLIVRLGFYSTYTPVGAVTYAGQTMQLLVSQRAADNNTYIQIYGLPNPATGTNQVSVTLYSPLGNAISDVAVESDSYIGVASVDAGATNSGNLSSPSLTVPSASGNDIVQGFSASAVGAGLTSYNQTRRYDSGLLQNVSNNLELIAGDAAGGSSVIFTAAGTPNYWVGAAVNLTPLPSTVIGSVFRAANTSTGTVSAASGSNLFVNGFYNTQVTASTDLTYAPSSFCTVTIEHAGTYSVTISVLLVSTFNNQLLGLNVIQNGTVTKRGHTSFISNGSFSTNYVVAHTFQVYCSAGDTLQPGYYCTTSGSAFTGTADGLSTYFEVSLNNRGIHS